MKNLITHAILVMCLGISASVWAQCDRPIINDFTPKTGFIESSVTIFGANFHANPDSNQVWFGATQAEITSASFGQLKVIVPVGANTDLISVKNECGLIGQSKVHFNGIFCPTPITNQSYASRDFIMSARGSYNMHAYDLDNDGRPEVISGHHTAGITIAHNQSTPGNLNFIRRDISSVGARFFVCQDFDGDGDLDFVYSQNNLYANVNNSTPGNISFGGVIQIAVISGFAYQMGAGDFNNDGKIDVAVGNNGGLIRFYRNISTGPGHIAFAYAGVQNVGSRCSGIQIADFDGDGKADFSASQGNANRVASLRNTTTDGAINFTFETPEFWPSLGTFPYRADLADFNKDGKMDITTCNYLGATNTAILRNTSSVGDISFATAVTLPAPTRNYRVGVGDADGDGYADIITKSLGQNVFSIYRNNSANSTTVAFDPRIDYFSSARAEVSGIVIADLDGDFVPDIATSGITSNAIYFHRNNSAQNDVSPPVAKCKDIILPLQPDGTASITANDIDDGSSDECGIDQRIVSQADFSCADIGENLVTLIVTDQAGNADTCEAIVNVQPAAVIISGQTTVCEGETVDMSANDGDSYQWFKDGVAIPGATMQQYSASESGDYSVEVINAGGCSGTSIPVSVVVNDNPTVDVSPSPIAYLCPNSATLTASQSAIYQWYDGNGAIPGATQQSYTTSLPGTYYVEVIDLFGCSATSDTVVVAPNPPDLVISGKGLVIAPGDNSPDTTDGTDLGDVFPNVNNHIQLDLDNNGLSDLVISSIQFSGPDAAFFSAALSTPATIAAGADQLTSLIFNAPDIRAYSASVAFHSDDCDVPVYEFALAAEITCVAAHVVSGPSDSLLSADGNCQASYSYSFEAGGLPAPSISYAISGATNTSGAGDGSGSTYELGSSQLVIYVSNPCGIDSHVVQVDVIDRTPPVISGMPSDISVEDTDTDCQVAVSWDAPSASDNCSVSLSSTHSSGDVFGLGTTTVEYTAIDGSGNSVSASFDVTVTAQALGLSLSSPLYDVAHVSCHGASDGSISSSVSGGCELYLYSWSNGESTADISGVSAGVYELVVTDNAGSTISETIVLTEPDELEASIAEPASSSFAVCAFPNTHLVYGYPDGETSSVQLDASAIGGNGDYSYSWAPSADLDDATSASPIFSPAAMESAGCLTHTLTVTITDDQGCSAQAIIEVNAAHVGIEVISGKGKKQKKDHKVLICHKNKKVISVDYHAIPAHLGHGDCLGACAGCDEGASKWADNPSLVEHDMVEGLGVHLHTYPNPSTGLFDVQLENVEGAVELILYDAAGSEIQRITTEIVHDIQAVSMGAEDLPNGVYTIKVNHAEFSTTDQVVIQK